MFLRSVLVTGYQDVLKATSMRSNVVKYLWEKEKLNLSTQRRTLKPVKQKGNSTWTRGDRRQQGHTFSHISCSKYLMDFKSGLFI